MRASRRKELAAYIARRGSVTMPELCRAFDVSMNTIRADVAFLVGTGTVEKIYGGVRSVAQAEVALFDQRAVLRPEAKRAAAAAAAALIRDGDTLFADAGTTTMHLLDYLAPEKHVTVVTGNLSLLPRAAALPNVELIVLPGTLNRRTNSVADVSTLEFLGRFHFARAFLAATGLSADGKLNVSSYLECEIKRLAVQVSDERILLCDSGKYGASALMSYAALSDMHRLITDAGCPAQLRALCARTGTELTVAAAAPDLS